MSQGNQLLNLERNIKKILLKKFKFKIDLYKYIFSLKIH